MIIFPKLPSSMHSHLRVSLQELFGLVFLFFVGFNMLVNSFSCFFPFFLMVPFPCACYCFILSFLFVNKRQDISFRKRNVIFFLKKPYFNYFFPFLRWKQITWWVNFRSCLPPPFHSNLSSSQITLFSAFPFTSCLAFSFLCFYFLFWVLFQ